jgi:hypothetical protein
MAAPMDRDTQHALYIKRLSAIPYIPQKTEAEIKELDSRKISIRDMVNTMESQIRVALNEHREKNKIGNLFGQGKESLSSGDECM